jgi:hypothetical protein
MTWVGRAAWPAAWVVPKTVLRPGQMPPHVTTAATTFWGSQKRRSLGPARANAVGFAVGAVKESKSTVLRTA